VGILIDVFVPQTSEGEETLTGHIPLRGMYPAIEKRCLSDIIVSSFHSNNEALSILYPLSDYLVAVVVAYGSMSTSPVASDNVESTSRLKPT
jgi:hypothetical protein